MVAWLDGTTTGRQPEDLEAWLDKGRVRMCNHASGDGSNEAVGLQAALDLAAASNCILELEAGKTYVTGSMLTATSTMRIEGNGACIKKSASLNGYALKVTGSNTIVLDLEIDGDRVGGNSNNVGCIWFNATSKAIRVYAHNGKVVGIFASGSSVTVTCIDCEASDILTTGTTGDGFQVGAGAILRTDAACRGYFNGHCTFHASASSADGCHLDGLAGNNGFSGASILSDNGTSNFLRTFNNQTYGTYGQTASGWTFEHIESDDEGQALNGVTWPQNASATSCEFLGCDSWDTSNLVSRRALGYGYALSTITGTGSTNMTLGRYNIDFPGDPGIFIGGNSQFNSFGAGRVRGDIAVSFGESVAGNNNDWNKFGFLHAIDCGFSVIRGTQAHYNTWGHVHATNCWNRSPYVGFVQWISGTPVGATCSHNRIFEWSSDNPGSPPSGAALPTYILNCDLGSTHNWILSGFDDSSIPQILEGGSGTNRVDFATAP